jgi:Na+/H+ antiporter NhaC
MKSLILLRIYSVAIVILSMACAVGFLITGNPNFQVMGISCLLIGSIGILSANAIEERLPK